MDERPGHIVELDGIRGFAILLVLVWHFIGCTVEPHTLAWKMTSLTWWGVDLFFVLSGFLIGGILMDNQTSPHFFKTFYLRRVARILPLYYVVVLLALVAVALRNEAGLGGSAADLRAVPWWAYVLHVQNIFMAASGDWGIGPLQVTWSLAVEEQFYLLFPVVIWLVRKRLVIYVLILGFISGWVFRVLSTHIHPHPSFASYVLLPCRWDSLFAGGLLAWAIRNKAGFLKVLQDARLRNTLLILLGSAHVILYNLDAGIGSRNAAYFGHTLFALTGVTLIAISVVAVKSRVRAFFRQRWLCWLGGISYGLYLSHMLALRSVYWLWTGSSTPLIHDLRSAGACAAGLAASVVVASVSWTFIEKPLVRSVRSRTYY